jgi:LysR family nitrogen assimilation transcriptional regulator
MTAIPPGPARLVRDAQFRAQDGALRSEAPGRASLSLRHAAGFLALAEEGSIGRAAARLGLGQSTLSGHVKALEAELHHPLVARIQGGLTITPAGWRAYGRLRPLLAGAAFALRRFRHNSGLPSHFVTVGLPAGFPGTPIDAAVSAVTAELAAAAPDSCFLVGTGDGAPAPQGIGVDYASGVAGVADRWLLLRHPAEGGPPGPAEAWAGLAGRELLLPRVSAGLAELVRAVAQQVGALVTQLELEPAALLAEARQRPGFCALLPQGLVNRALAAALDVRPMAPGPADPVLTIGAPGMPAVAPILAHRLRQALDQPDSLPPPPPPELLSLKHCRSFLTLCEERHVGRAAKRLFIVQPALTMQLHQIEAQLGATLFERTGRGMLPTAAALRLQAHLTPLLGDIDAAIAALRQPIAPAMPRLHIGLIPSLDDESLTTEGFVQALQQWQAQHGEIQVQVVEAFSDELVQWLRTRRIDLAIVDRRFAEPLLQVEPIAEDPMAAVVDAARGLLPPGPVRLQDLSRLRLVLPSGRHGLRILLSRHLAAHGLALEPSVEVDSMAAALRLVRSGPYATVLPVGAILRSSARRGLAVHGIEAPRLMRELCLARSRAVPARQPVLALMRELRAAFASQAALLA